MTIDKTARWLLLGAKCRNCTYCYGDPRNSKFQFCGFMICKPRDGICERWEGIVDG